MSAWRKLFLILSLMGLHRLGICSAFTTSRTPVQKGQQSATELRLFNNLILPNRQRDALSVNGDGQNGKVNDARDKIPFVLEQLGDRPREQVFKDIAEMCISVFFNNGKTGRALP